MTKQKRPALSIKRKPTTLVPSSSVKKRILLLKNSDKNRPQEEGETAKAPPKPETKAEAGSEERR